MTLSKIRDNEITSFIYDYLKPQAVHAAAKLGLAELLWQCPLSAAAVADRLGSDRVATAQLLQLLEKMDIVEMQEDRFALTVLGERLRPDAPDSLVGIALFAHEMYHAFGQLSYTVKTGRPGFDKAFGQSLYQYLESHPEADQAFAGLTAGGIRDWVLPVLDHLDLAGRGASTLVDVGGGNGALLAELLKKHQDLSGVLFERKQVLSQAPEVLGAAGVLHRCRLVAGDFFIHVPAGGDIYLISRVLLNWNDDNAIRILSRCREVMRTEARMVILDYMLIGDQPSYDDLLFGFHMLMLGDGRPLRSADEFSRLLERAGFQRPRLIETGSPFRFLEAAPRPI